MSDIRYENNITNDSDNSSVDHDPVSENSRWMPQNGFDDSEEDEELRSPDSVLEDRLIGYGLGEEDMFMRRAIEESLKQFHETQMIQQQRLEKERQEQIILETRKKKLGLMVSRLRMLLTNPKNELEKSILEDILQAIEWSCTPSVFLSEFRPTFQSPSTKIKEWITQHLPSSFQLMLEEENILIFWEE